MKKTKMPILSNGEQRTNLRMSKLSRMLQSAAAETNWEDMVKLLFRSDPHSGRNLAMRKILSRKKKNLSLSRRRQASYSTDQLQYVLFLMLIISVAEKHTQDLYRNQYAQRCEKISKKYGLADEDYWPEGKAPAEWNELNQEFEQHSLRILLETLTDYHQNEIAKLVKAGGIEQLFAIINSVKSQFFAVFKDSKPLIQYAFDQQGSLPETLQSKALDLS